jgi:hypothetical protein
MVRAAPRIPGLSFGLVVSLLTGQAASQVFQPYGAPQVSIDEFVRYAEQVRQSYGPTAEVIKEEHVIVFSDQRTRTFWVFTTKDHPAHPAWITRQMYEEDGQVKVRQIGYFAGSEPQFAKLFHYYQERNAQLVEDVQRRNQ